MHQKLKKKTNNYSDYDQGNRLGKFIKLGIRSKILLVLSGRMYWISVSAEKIYRVCLLVKENQCFNYLYFIQLIHIDV